MRISKINHICIMPQDRSYPTIQAFYQKEVPLLSSSSQIPSISSKPGDGFAETEIDTAIDPLLRKWNPSIYYTDTAIGELHTGPRAVTFSGRVLNFKTFSGKSKSEKAARGWIGIVLGDGTGCIYVSAATAKDFNLITIQCNN
jgi:hypothetical protein